MPAAQLIQMTRQRFGLDETASLEMVPIEKGGSDRIFYRLRQEDGKAMILVQYSDRKEENRHYVDIAKYLEKAGVPVPAVHFHDSENGIIWMEDLGHSDLWAYREGDPAVRREMYLSALEAVHLMHSSATAGAGESGLLLQREFDASLYRWEQNYFFENCLGGYFGVPKKKWRALESLPTLQQLATNLAALPRVLVHRDFQSQNILIHEGRAHLIDFQGMRFGLAGYDLASLLYDPYARLPAAEREELLAAYATIAGIPKNGRDEFRMTFRLCAIQRLMQALGAYGKLGLSMGKRHFLHHIPVALPLLLELLPELEEVDPLIDALEDAARSRRIPITTT